MNLEKELIDVSMSTHVLNQMMRAPRFKIIAMRYISGWGSGEACFFSTVPSEKGNKHSFSYQKYQLFFFRNIHFHFEISINLFNEKMNICII
ncbi:Hypothetical protein TFLO_2743 [Trichococcus flocculiformis]|uniref:Uncharacterized protein n=1 Tax=Trichococcus flocculiformis TaxID=82803 RepID=A0AB38BKQ2_9LACT|nr:Hypothetical protein TFLO_2743 [Trichococcus flocculiformis]SFI10426.1 hypothetical protein SAMN04488507_10512 [Trichococcus flocculiformis]